MTSSYFMNLLASAVAVIVGIVIHESAHAAAAWALGDKTAQLFGAEPVGLPTGAGYAAGVRLVSEYLHLHGGTAASNVHTPVETVLSDVLPRLGLGDE